MDDGSRLYFFFAFLLLFCAAYFAAAETALSSCSRGKIKAAADRGDSRAEKTLYVLDSFDRAITTLLICTNIIHISAATLVTVAVTRIWREEAALAVTVATLVTTVAVFFAGEMLPKSVAKKYSESFSLRCGGTVKFFMGFFAPLSSVLTGIGRAASRLTPGEAELSVTEEEIYDIIEDMTEEGSLDEEQGELISSALQFADVTVESILTPRVDLIAINVSDTLDSVLSLIKSTNHSRLPAYEGSIDNIIGILQIRKFIKAYLHLGEALELRSLLDEPMFVHQSTNIDDLLPTMSKKRQNIAVVTDNYGGTVGIVTVEDILEELVGEIWDEDDVVAETVEELGGGEFRVDAEESVSDVFDRIGFEDPEEDEELVNTLMGEWAYQQFPGIPHSGDRFTYHGLSIAVNAMEHNRILDLRVTVLPAPEGGEEL